MSQPSRPTQPRPVPRQHATIQTSTTEPQDTVIARLQKCLDRANHPNSSQSEVEAALVLANRLMQQHNITHADLLAQAEGEGGDNAAQYTGCSVVSIRTTIKGGSVIKEAFVSPAAKAMEMFFDCKSYSIRELNAIKWTFYGIAENAAAAAMAFEMVHNLIVDWARGHRGKSASHSYCLGVAEGLEEVAREEKKLETEKAREAGPKALTQATRLSFNNETVRKEQGEDEENNGITWNSAMQLVRFRETAEKAAENWLKQQEIKLTHRKSRRTAAKDPSSYSQGKEDSKKINVRQQRLE